MNVCLLWSNCSLMVLNLSASVAMWNALLSRSRCLLTPEAALAPAPPAADELAVAVKGMHPHNHSDEHSSP